MCLYVVTTHPTHPGLDGGQVVGVGCPFIDTQGRPLLHPPSRGETLLELAERGCRGVGFRETEDLRTGPGSQVER